MFYHIDHIRNNLSYDTFLYIKVIGSNFRVSYRRNGKALLGLIRKEHPTTRITTLSDTLATR